MIATACCSSIIDQIIPQTGGWLAVFNAPKFLPEGLSRFLFEPQWVVWIVLGLLAVGLIVMAGRTNKRLALVGQILAAVVIVWILTAHWVDTRDERLYAVTKRILDATVAKDSGAVLAQMDDDFKFGDIRKADLADALKGMLPALNITSHTVRLYESEPGDPDPVVHLNVISSFGKEGSLLTRWVLTFKEEADGSFKLHNVTEWRINDEPQKMVFPQIPGI